MGMPNFYGHGTLGFDLHSPHNGWPGLERLYSRTDCLSRQCEEIGLPTSMNSWKRNKKASVVMRLLLDSGVVDVTISYNAICTSRIILEGIVFQEPYKRVEPSRRPCEHKTLESNKSLT